MDFFEKIGKKAEEAYKVTADKTGKIAKETKLKIEMGKLKTKIDGYYEEIGKVVYEHHQKNEDVNKEKIDELCSEIDSLSDKIYVMEKECLDLKEKKQCKNCFKEIERNSKYCPNCGAEQDEMVEEKQEDDDKIENQVEIEELEIENNVEESKEEQNN